MYQSAFISPEQSEIKRRDILMTDNVVLLSDAIYLLFIASLLYSVHYVSCQIFIKKTTHVRQCHWDKFTTLYSAFYSL